MIAKKWVEPGTLYVVGTPIGNQSDWTFRALDVLAEVDRVLAEDTRETRQVFHAHDIHTPLVSLHEHNWRQRLPDIRRWLESGEALALVSDRGMPAVSDPGQEVVDYCRTEGFPVSVVPGPSAVVTAFAASGFPHPFIFWGFLPRQRRARDARLEEIRQSPYTQILYEAPHRLADTVDELARHLGDDCPVFIGREMTKRFEEFWRGTLGALRQRTEWRGEWVIVLGPKPQETTRAGEIDWSLLAARVRAQQESGMAINEAIKRVAGEAGVTKRELYRYIHQPD